MVTAHPTTCLKVYVLGVTRRGAFVVQSETALYLNSQDISCFRRDSL